MKLHRVRDRHLQLFVVNEESLVSTIHNIVLTASLPFVHTARRFNRLDDPANSVDMYQSVLRLMVTRKQREPYHLEDEEVVTRYP